MSLHNWHKTSQKYRLEKLHFRKASYSLYMELIMCGFINAGMILLLQVQFVII